MQVIQVDILVEHDWEQPSLLHLGIKQIFSDIHMYIS